MPSRSTKPPIRVTGLRRFADIEESLEPHLRRLWTAKAAPRGEHDGIPCKPGLYLFAERGRPLYVGQTRNLKRRLAEHTWPSSTQEQASFAFLLAKRKAARRGRVYKGTRKAVASHRGFEPLFRKEKARVARMDVRFVVEKNPGLRTVFEVYATLALCTTRYNRFETH
jgi:hypothetical protein